jgi:hypothetical protein
MVRRNDKTQLPNSFRLSLHGNLLNASKKALAVLFNLCNKPYTFRAFNAELVKVGEYILEAQMAVKSCEEFQSRKNCTLFSSREKQGFRVYGYG